MEGFDGSPDGAILPPDEADARAFAVHVMECQARADGLDDEQICACVNDGDFPHGISNWAVGRGEYWTLESEDDEQGDDERGDDEPGEVAANLPRPTTDWLGDHESIAAVFRVRRLEFGPSCSARGVETLGFIVRGIELNDDGSLALTKDNFTQMDLNHFNIAGNNRFAGELYGVPDHGVPSSYRGVKDQVARTLLNRALPFDSE
jgi:hypothetical protein